MSESASQSRGFADWWKVMQQACDAMSEYVDVIDRDDIPPARLETIKAELLAKAARLNQLAEQTAATGDTGNGRMPC